MYLENLRDGREFAASLACVEVAWRHPQPPSTSDGVLVRDSKNPAGGMLTVPVVAWHRLLAVHDL